jgi:molybdopterin molybdotransferase
MESVWEVRMISIREAQGIILEGVKVVDAETVPVLAALQRVTAEEVRSPWDIPSADCSAMDGYAFAVSSAAAPLRQTAFLAAGGILGAAVPPGEAVRIMTGAPVPAGCDAVVPLEETENCGDRIVPTVEVRTGMNIRRCGEDVRAGDLVIPEGTLIRPPEIGMLVSLGRGGVSVRRRVRGSVLATGDELMEPGERPGPGKVMNSNSYGISAQILEAGGEPVPAGIARDDVDGTARLLDRALSADFVVTTGGVSVGDHDFVREAILRLGGEILFWKVNMKPGKPMAFGLVAGKPVFALPGNPVAAMVAFEQFVRPALLKMAGHRRLLRPVVRATLTEGVRNSGERPHLVRGRVEMFEGRYTVSVAGSQGSARISSLVESNALMQVPAESALAPGDEVDVHLLDRSFEMGEFDGAL